MPAESLPHRRFTVAEVVRMVETGVLAEDEPVELIDGDLVVVPPQGPEHSERITHFTMLLVPRYAGRAHVRVQLPLWVDETTLPEPDIAVARPTPGRHPAGADTLLVIEIARTSHALDRSKARVYARGRVPLYWLVDLVARRIEERADPSAAGDYRVTKIYLPEDDIELPGLDERVRVSTLLGV